jgi:hypothetical protein
MVPLHTLEQEKGDLAWKSGSKDVVTLGKSWRCWILRGAFTEAHKLGQFGWFPAPVVADETVDQFCEDVFAMPLLLKSMDVHFVLRPEILVRDHS